MTSLFALSNRIATHVSHIGKIILEQIDMPVNANVMSTLDPACSALSLQQCFTSDETEVLALCIKDEPSVGFDFVLATNITFEQRESLHDVSGAHIPWASPSTAADAYGALEALLLNLPKLQERLSDRFTVASERLETALTTYLRSAPINEGINPTDVLIELDGIVAAQTQK